MVNKRERARRRAAQRDQRDLRPEDWTVPRGQQASDGFGTSSRGEQSRTESSRHVSLTMMEEARNTERRPRSFVMDHRLRNNPVIFRRAEEFDVTKETAVQTGGSEDETTKKELGGNLESSEHDPTEVSEVPASATQAAPRVDKSYQGSDLIDMQDPSEGPKTEGPRVQREHPLFFVDVRGSKTPIETEFASPKVAPPSPTLSASSEEVVMFKGRNSKVGGRSGQSSATSPPRSATSHHRQGVGSSNEDKRSHGRTPPQKRSMVDEAHPADSSDRVGRPDADVASDGESEWIEDYSIHDNDSLETRTGMTGMTDERMARLLSIQEGLGMGSEDLLLFDDDDVFKNDDIDDQEGDESDHDDDNDDDDDDDEGGYDADDNDVLNKGEKNQRSGAVSNGWRGQLRASVMKTFGDFTVTDRTRPTLPSKSKRVASLPLQLSDTELEANLQMSWAKDRAKKAAQKKEREELRARGLLGNKKNWKRVKGGLHTDGIFIHNIKRDIERFLISSQVTFTLEPMDKRSRSMVHELANAFGLKSKSTGFGDTRFTTLMKTPQTGAFKKDTLEIAEARLESRAFYWRFDSSTKGPRQRSDARPHRAPRASRDAGVSYRDGDIVGAAAPELGAENKGRAMLEKMGWSSGTALGAVDNKGILHPLAHVVKTSKAGLG